MVDPITATLVEYDSYLRNGGEPVNLAKMGFGVCSERKRVRKLHPSSLGPGLCDRKACYRIMADIGEIPQDFETTPEEDLGHRVGYIFEDWVSEALAWKGALVDLQPALENEHWVARPDQIVDPRRLGITAPDPGRWLVDCKTVKGYGFYDRYPKEYHISQLEQYARMLDYPVKPLLFYMTRIDFQTALWTWEWDEYDCIAGEWGTGKRKVFPRLKVEQTKSITALGAWLLHNTLPDRCCDKPTDHFMCANYQKYGPNKGMYKVGCQFFGRCWDTVLPEGLVFPKDDWEDEDSLPF